MLQTHKFKAALKTSIDNSIRPRKGAEQSAPPAASSIDSLGHLQPILNRFIIGYTDSSFYIFDLKTSSIVLWNKDFENIDTIKVIGENIIVIFTKGAGVFTFQIQKLDEIFFELLSEQDFLECGRFLLRHVDYFKNKLTDDKFILYLSILKNKLKQIGEAEDLLDQVKGAFDELVAQLLREKDRKEMEQIEMTTSTQMENGVFLVENSYAAVVKRTMQPHKNEVIANGTHKDGKAFNDDDDDIVVKKPATKLRLQKVSALSPLALIEPAPLTEDEKTARSLFLVYKSLKMSSFNMVDRYASTFDQLDIPGIAKLLGRLAQMIVENEAGTTPLAAQQYCYEMLFNYLSSELIWEMDEWSREYIVDAFIIVNAQRQQQQCDRNVQRCEYCDFPLVVEMFILKYKSVSETLIKYFWSHNERRKCFDIVTKVPVVLTTVLKLVVNDQLGVDLEHEERENVEKLIDMLFACADKGLLERCIRHNDWFRASCFWELFFQRLVQMHSDKKIMCVDCERLSTIKCNKLGSSKSFYSFDYALQLCADNMDGLAALRFSKKYAEFIASDALGKDFYLKCLLNS